LRIVWWSLLSVLAQMLANHKPPFPSIYLDAMYIG